jgi:hypothetical protein
VDFVLVLGHFPEKPSRVSLKVSLNCRGVSWDVRARTSDHVSWWAAAPQTLRFFVGGSRHRDPGGVATTQPGELQPPKTPYICGDLAGGSPPTEGSEGLEPPRMEQALGGRQPPRCNGPRRVQARQRWSSTSAREITRIIQIDSSGVG